MKGVLAALLLAVWIPAIAICAELPAELAIQLEKSVQATIDEQNVPGIVAALAVGGEEIWSGAWGFADLENDVPATTDTVFRIASLSKPITAVAILQLWEAEKIDLDAPVRTYVPEFPAKPWPVTIRQLLCHQGGIRHYSNRWTEVNHTLPYDDLVFPLRMFKDDELVAEPGTFYHYSTFGYVLLGAVVEKVSGMRFEDYLRQHVFGPAGMRRTQADSVPRLISNRSRYYRPTKEGTVANAHLVDTSYKIPGGGLVSTASDLVRFAIAIQRGVLLTPDTVSLMLTPQQLRDGEPTGYALGWRVYESAGMVLAGHGGNQNGATAQLAMTQQGATVALLANLELVDLPTLATQILLMVN